MESNVDSSWMLSFGANKVPESIQKSIEKRITKTADVIANKENKKRKKG